MEIFNPSLLCLHVTQVLKEIIKKKVKSMSTHILSGELAPPDAEL